jgi:glutaredoxin-like protein
MIDDRTAEKARELLGKLVKPVRLEVFTQEFECTYCQQNDELVQDIAGLSEAISHEVHRFEEDKGPGKKLGIDKIPAIAVTSDGEDFGIRFFGIPSGYEFVSLLDAIRTVSTGNHELSNDTVEKVRALDRPVHIQVFVTPTCPYCPKSVVLAHRIAFASKQVSSDMVEAMEFPHLTHRYSVAGVPRSVINEDHFIEGAVPEKAYVQRILDAVSGA